MVEAAQSLEEREGIDYEGFDDPATQQSEACEGGLAGARAAALWHLSRDPTCRYPYIHHMYKHVHPDNQKYIQCTYIQPLCSYEQPINTTSLSLSRAPNLQYYLLPRA